MRSSSDPFDNYPDSELLHVLTLTGLKPYLDSLPNGLHSVVEEYGENMVWDLHMPQAPVTDACVPSPGHVRAPCSVMVVA